jgi:hypothetical protein
MTGTAIARATDLHYRIWNEFREMPGSRLTLAQARRLFGGDPRAVDRAVQDLVDAAVLRQIGPYYLRADLDRFAA